MLQPLRAAAAAHPEMRDRLEIYQRRLDQEIAAAPPCEDDKLTSSAIEGLARRTQNGHDSVQQLAMDLQWELNRLSKAMSPESIDGATAYGLSAADRTIVQAFMHGVNQTRKLNSIDLDSGRPRRAKAIACPFRTISGRKTFTSSSSTCASSLPPWSTPTFIARACDSSTTCLLAYDIQWEAASVAAGANHEKTIGRYTAENQESLERFLAFVGSRLVFLLDWNRARKRLGAVRQERRGDRAAQVGGRQQRRPPRVPAGRRCTARVYRARACRAAAGPVRRAPRRSARGRCRAAVHDVGAGHRHRRVEERPLAAPDRRRGRGRAAHASSDDGPQRARGRGGSRNRAVDHRRAPLPRADACDEGRRTRRGRQCV